MNFSRCAAAIGLSVNATVIELLVFWPQKKVCGGEGDDTVCNLIILGPERLGIPIATRSPTLLYTYCIL
jgi:hypothetical protein